MLEYIIFYYKPAKWLIGKNPSGRKIMCVKTDTEEMPIVVEIDNGGSIVGVRVNEFFAPSRYMSWEERTVEGIIRQYDMTPEQLVRGLYECMNRGAFEYGSFEKALLGKYGIVE